MKTIKRILLVLVLVLPSIACKLFTGNVPSTAVNTPAVDFTAPADPLNVTVQLDEAFTVSGMFSPNGSAMSLTSADGTVFTLEVPKGALEVDTALTMTAVKSIAGAPLDSGAVFAVQFEPSGLVFNEILTLTIVPAQDIPINNQIIFGYEGSGQDYHLAVVDSKSREIKIKLMGFSGVGVGSGGDKEWAANLQVQASNTSTRLWQKLAEITQAQRQAYFINGEEAASTEEIFKPILDQFYDQVVLKEIAAAELDCQYAQKALADLFLVERQRQLMGLSSVESITTIDFAGKTEKLKKIWEKCKKSYSISGGAGDFSGTGTICDIEQPWTVTGSGVTVTFTPSSANGGTYSYSGTMLGLTVNGTGEYTVSYQGDVAVSIQAGGEGSVGGGGGGSSGSGDESYTLTPLAERACP